MKITDLVTLSAKNLARRKGRTALTVVGVVVGTCAVIVMISLGLAMSRSNEEMIASFGDLTQIELYHWDNSTVKLDDAMLAQFETIDHVVATTPQLSPSIQGTIYAEKNKRYTTDVGSAMLYGMSGDAMPLFGYELSSGSWLEDGVNYGNGKIPILVCEGTAYNFCDSRKNPSSRQYQRSRWETDEQGNPLYKPFFDINDTTLTLELTDGDTDNPKTKEYQLVVVGTIKQDQSKGWWTDSGMVMRVSDVRLLTQAYQKLINSSSREETTYDQVYIKVDEVNNVADVDQAIQDMGFKNETYSMTSVRDDMQKQVRQSQLILGGLAAISLLVAALNIANTMTMAIYERTREIGVMKVLGCELGQIRAMFLIESGFIGLLGGIAGTLVSLGISWVLNHIEVILSLFGASGDLSGLMSTLGGGWGASSSTISIVPPWLVAAALVFATCIGLVSGIAPAGRAVKISALEAIRHD